LQKARADAEQLLADGRAKAEAVRQDAEHQAEAERDQIVTKARQEADRIHSQSLASAQLKARTLKLERREELLDSVFDVVRERLPTVRQWTDYKDVVRELTEEAVAQLSASEAIVMADEEAHRVLAEGVLSEISDHLGVSLQLGDKLPQATGVVAATLDGHRQYDNTLEARLKRWQEELRFPVHRLLMGESL
jgi:vacuolar-type H+-ATPase subunit E/Vma4